MKVKTSELEGAALDYAVAKCAAKEVYIDGAGQVRHGRLGVLWQPTKSWSCIGPLIDFFDIDIHTVNLLTSGHSERKVAVVDGIARRACDTPVAACRAIVAAKLGDTVDIPDELVSKDG